MQPVSFHLMARFQNAIRLWQPPPVEDADDPVDTARVPAPRKNGPQGRTPAIALVEPDDAPVDLDAISGRDTFRRF